MESTHGGGAAAPPRGEGRLRRAAVTLTACAALLVGERIPLPYVDDEWLRGLMRVGSLRSLSPLALGFVPFITAFVAVEFAAAVVPRWRCLRDGTTADRDRLVRAAWVLAFLLAAIHAWSMTGYLRSIRGGYGEPILPPELLPELAVGASLTAGVALSGVLAGWISSRGLGNGFAVLLTVQLLASYSDEVLRIVLMPPGQWSDVSLLVVLALALLVPLVAGRATRSRDESAPRFPVPTCSLVVLQLSAGVFGVAYALVDWLAADPDRWLRTWLPAPRGYWISVGLVVVLAVPLAGVFFPRDVVAATFRRAQGPGEDDAGGGVRRALAAAHLRSLALVTLLAMLPRIGGELGAAAVPSSGFVIALAMAFAVAVDLAGEWRARALAGALVPVRPLHRVYAVEPVLAALRAAGIPGHARTHRFRALFHFFAPYAPIEILVAPERAQEADAIAARVVGAAV